MSLKCSGIGYIKDRRNVGLTTVLVATNYELVASCNELVETA